MKMLTASMAALVAVTLTCQSQASPVIITSPDQCETLADSSIQSRGLHWNARRHALTAVITFSNINYASHVEERHDDTFGFLLPGVKYDEAKNVFYVVARNGERTPIATFKPLLFGKTIQLLPGATVFVNEHYGKISVTLRTSPEPASEPHWQEVRA